MTCSICKEPSVDSLEFETGNNAKHQTTVNLCEAHMKEAEETGYDFEQKYAEQILECLYEDWRDLGDALRDRAKYEDIKGLHR